MTFYSVVVALLFILKLCKTPASFFKNLVPYKSQQGTLVLPKYKAVKGLIKQLATTPQHDRSALIGQELVKTTEQATLQMVEGVVEMVEVGDAKITALRNVEITEPRAVEMAESRAVEMAEHEAVDKAKLTAVEMAESGIVEMAESGIVELSGHGAYEPTKHGTVQTTDCRTVETTDFGIDDMTECTADGLIEYGANGAIEHSALGIGEGGADAATNEQSLQCHAITADKLSINYKDFHTGTLKQSWKYWKNIGTSEYILSIIKHGYKIPFLTTPKPILLKNNHSSLANSSFVIGEINLLLKRNCVEQCALTPTVVNPLTVSKSSSGKLRLILDLRHINLHLFKDSVKYQDLDTLSSLVHKNNFLAKFDLKSGYHHVDIFPEHQQYLGFSFNINGTEKYFKFKVLPFGISSACYLFTKLLKPITSYWNHKGIKCIMYLDDGIVIHNDEFALSNQCTFIRDSLREAGFYINEEKSNWQPQTSLEWLGIIIDTLTYTFILPDRKREGILKHIDDISARHNLSSARELASLAGKIISTKIATGPMAIIRTKCMYMGISRREKWSSVFQLDSSILSEFSYWKIMMSKTIASPISDLEIPTLDLFTDASAYAGGGFLDQQRESVAFFQFSDIQAQESSTHRELAALLYSVKFFSNIITEQTINWFTDSKNSASAIKKGSMNASIQRIVIDVHNELTKSSTVIRPNWIKRNSNAIADRISKLPDTDEWIISDMDFKHLNQIWGPYKCDVFATAENTKCPLFYTKYFDSSATGTDAFAQHWFINGNWIVPPVTLIGKVVNFMSTHAVSGTLIVPDWKSSYFWPLLFNQGGTYRDFVSDVQALKCISQLSKSNRSKKFKGFTLLALRINFQTPAFTQH